MNPIRTNDDHSYQFLKSAFAAEGSVLHTSQVISWLAEQNQRVKLLIRKTSFDRLSQWSLEDGSFRHDSGRFFNIDGIRVNTNWGNISNWDQPIINQPEIGYLGFITKEFNGILHFLIQAKIEPGNVILDIIVSKNSTVFLPGLIPGINPPFFFISSAICPLMYSLFI